MQIKKYHNTNLYIIFSPKKWGGVRSVSEGLFYGLKNNNERVVLIKGWSSLWSIKVIKYFLSSETFFISSLSFGILNLFKRKKSAYILHGYPTHKYHNFFMYITILWFTRLISKISSFTFSVSQQTRFINRDILNINSNYILSNGLIPSLKTLNKMNSNKKIRKDFIYAGTFSEGKNIISLIDAFIMYRESGGKNDLIICGDGSLRNEVLSKIKNFPSIKYKGVLSNQKLLNEYLNCKTYISLNDGEPFGISMLEALSYGCLLICPSSGGQIDFATHALKNIFFIRDVNDSYAISLLLKKADEAKAVKSNILNDFNYKKLVENSLLPIISNNQ